jgi:hypothetical protein
MYLALRNIQESAVAEKQKWVPVAQLSGYKTFLSTLNTIIAVKVFV